MIIFDNFYIQPSLVVLALVFAFGWIIRKYILYKKISDLLTVIQQIYTKGNFLENSYVLATAKDNDYKYNLLSCGEIIYKKIGISNEEFIKEKNNLLYALILLLCNIKNRNHYYTISLPDNFGILDKSEKATIMKLFYRHNKYNFNKNDII